MICIVYDAYNDRLAPNGGGVLWNNQMPGDEHEVRMRTCGGL